MYALGCSFARPFTVDMGAPTPVAPQILSGAVWNTPPRVGEALDVSPGTLNTYFPSLTANTFEVFDGDPTGSGVSIHGPASLVNVRAYVVAAAQDAADLYLRWVVTNSEGSAMVDIAAPGAVLPAVSAPSATLNVDLTGRSVTAWLTAVSGAPGPTPALDVFTAAGTDVRDSVTGTGTQGDPWHYIVPSRPSVTDIVIGASLDNGVAPAWSDTDSTIQIPSDQTAPVVTVALAKATYADGETVNATDIVPTISATGNPALQSADLTLVLMVDGTVASLPHTAQDGELLEPRVTASHATGAIDVTGSGVTVGPGFGLSEIGGTFEVNGATGTITMTVTAPATYADYNAGNGPGVFTFDASDLAAGPAALVPPRIVDDGSPEDGETLTIIPGLWVYDPTNGSLGTPSYQWQADAGGDAIFTDIPGATSNSYVLTSGESGDDVRIQETLVDNAGSRTATSASVAVALASVDPEAGLTQDATFAVGASVSVPGAERAVPVVMACDFTGLDGSAGGVIMEHGGTGLGVFVGFNPDGTFVMRCGNGGDSTTAWPAGTAYIEMTSGQPNGDGTLVWEANTSTGAVRAWWNGVAIGTPGGSLGGNNWTGGNKGAYLGTDLGSSLTGDNPGEHGLDSPTVVAHTTASALRIYYDEISSA